MNEFESAGYFELIICKGTRSCPHQNCMTLFPITFLFVLITLCFCRSLIFNTFLAMQLKIQELLEKKILSYFAIVVVLIPKLWFASFWRKNLFILKQHEVACSRLGVSLWRNCAVKLARLYIQSRVSGHKIWLHSRIKSLSAGSVPVIFNWLFKAVTVELLNQYNRILKVCATFHTLRTIIQLVMRPHILESAWLTRLL